MLNKLNIKTAYIGTIGFYIEDRIIELSNTTPEILDIYTMLIEAKEKGCKVVVMEVSSHALELKRVEGLKFTIEAFTNLTEDHLDFHKTMQNYLSSKLLILSQLNNNGKIIINNDDKYGNNFKLHNKYKTIGFNLSDYQIIKYKNLLTGTKIFFKYNNKKYNVQTNLKGKFNIYNFITALAILNEYNIPLKEIINISKLVYAPKGRCEIINIKKSLVIIDYAHTHDAVQKIIETFSEGKKGKIIVIIGCGGDRDPLKRPIMGKIASDSADYVIFTNDNPRTEDENKIIKDILKGVEKENYEVILDRKNAINKGLNLLNKNDILLILGKGHEDYQIIGHTKYHLDDKKIVLEYLENNN